MSLAPSLPVTDAALPRSGSREVELHRRIDDLRVAMDSEMGTVRQRCQEYLQWYSPPWNVDLRRHDAWDDEIMADDYGTTRANFPIARACVDIWAALEASQPPSSRAEPERIPAPPPMQDEFQAAQIRELFSTIRDIEARKAEMRSSVLRNWRWKDQFPLKNFRATRRKNLYGFSYVKVLPSRDGERPYSYPVKDPTTVYPMWSDTEPDDMEAVLCAYQMNARLAAAKYPQAGLEFLHKDPTVVDVGNDRGNYRAINNRFYNQNRTMVWIEECWWVERTYQQFRQTGSKVCMVIRVAGRLVRYEEFEDWRYVPFVAFENQDEGDSFGWSDIASVIDINDEFNRRLSQQGDIIGMYASPRFQLLGGIETGSNVEMPAPFELVPLRDTQRIEQILTRIDAFPGQIHLNTLTDMLHRVTGLPPIVWGLIANAQTSGRALTASWKATETRLAPKLMQNEASLRRWDRITLDYTYAYNWLGARRLFEDRAGNRFDDFRYEFPPMEPRDFMEVTQDAITKRDAKLITSEMAARMTGDENAEDTIEEVKAELTDPALHPAEVQSQELLLQARLQNLMQMQQMGMAPPGTPGGPAFNTGNVQQAIGQAAAAQPPPGAVPVAEGGNLPPTQPGANGNVAPPGADTQTSSGELMRGGEVSNQFLRTTRY